jgi:hypothetical protein
MSSGTESGDSGNLGTNGFGDSAVGVFVGDFGDDAGACETDKEVEKRRKSEKRKRKSEFEIILEERVYKKSLKNDEKGRVELRRIEQNKSTSCICSSGSPNNTSVHLQRIRLNLAKGSSLVFSAALHAAAGVPKTFQSLRVSSMAAVATVHPSGLCVMCSTLEV